MHFFIPHSRAQCDSYLRLLEESLTSRGHRCTFAESKIAPEPGDILWIHWPDTLTGQQPLNQQSIESVANWLDQWRRNNHILWTVHNLHKQDAPLDVWANALFLLVAESAHVQIHHGNASANLASIRFPEAAPRVTKVIHHGGYFNLLGSATRESARAKLGILAKDRVLLTFGSIRTPEEYQMIVEAAAAGWHVLVAGRVPTLPMNVRLKNWFRSIYTSLNVTMHQGDIADSDVDTYVKACDAMLIARGNSLNSGNIYLGMTFGRALIGPDIGNIGEVLRLTGNHTFNPYDPVSIRQTLSSTLKMDLDAYGLANAKWIEENGQWSNMAEAAEYAIEQIHNVETLQPVA